MDQIILNKFKLWTENLSPQESRIRIFEEIRDIPYYLVAAIDDPYAWAASILETNKASCSPKHYLLGFLFAKLGLPIQYVTYPFKWEEQPLNYPEELRKMAKGLPAAYHLACKVDINDKWVLVDATWDMALKKAGFSVNEHWDGLSHTVNAVVPFNEIRHSSVEERLAFVKERKSLHSGQEQAFYAEFVAKFNSWIDDLRKTK